MNATTQANAQVDLSLTPITPSQLHELLTQAIPAGLPILITSAPGIGKTSIVKQAAAACGADCMILHPVTSDPTDFKGFPWVTKEGAEFLAFGDLRRMIETKKRMVVFLDDLGQATEAVQAAAMQLVLGRQINGHAISDEVVFMAATNRRGDKAGVRGILEPLKSRFATIVELITNAKDWLKWANGANLEGVVRAFISYRPAMLWNFAPSADMTNSPCPRTWNFISDWLQKCTIPKEMRLTVYGGAVGKAAAVEFVAYMGIWESLIPADVVFANPDTAEIPREPSALYALATSLADKVGKDTMDRYCKYLERLIKAGRGEFCALSIKQALNRAPRLTNTQAYIKAAAGPIGQLLIGD